MPGWSCAEKPEETDTDDGLVPRKACCQWHQGFRRTRLGAGLAANHMRAPRAKGQTEESAHGAPPW